MKVVGVTRADTHTGRKVNPRDYTGDREVKESQNNAPADSDSDACRNLAVNLGLHFP